MTVKNLSPRKFITDDFSPKLTKERKGKKKEGEKGSSQQPLFAYSYMNPAIMKPLALVKHIIFQNLSILWTAKALTSPDIHLQVVSIGKKNPPLVNKQTGRLP